MNWQDFHIMLYFITALWILGSVVLLLAGTNRKLNVLAQLMVITGNSLLYYFIVQFWIAIERPPFRTIAETRMWYSIFISLIGVLLYYRYKYKILLVFSLLFALVFLWINYFTPGNYDKTLMPALQSPWFIPHVVVYMLGYAILGLSFIVSIWGIYKRKSELKELIVLADNLVYIGFALLSFGLIFGALWAKIAWGHYWTWDPKETWALISWLVYLLYIHFALKQKVTNYSRFVILAIAFVFVLICWLGINYLPSAQGSIHVYSS